MWPTIDHSILSPSGRVSKIARKRALERTRKELFLVSESPTAPISQPIETLNETGFSVGQNVTVRWTNCNKQYQGKGKIEKINKKSIRVSLTETVPSQIGYSGYPVGQVIIVPVDGTEFNCVIVEDKTI